MPSYFQLFSEFFYLQSYISRIWQHTWSLAVETHFYLLFALAISIFSGQRLSSNPPGKALMVSVLLFASLVARFSVSWPHRDDDFYDFMQTHLRSDGILFGILAAFLLQNERFKKTLQRQSWIALVFALLLLTPGLYFDGGSFFMNTAGLTLSNLSFAILVSLMFLQNGESKYVAIAALGRCLSFIGLASYSIYLWHLVAHDTTALLVQENSKVFNWIYIPLAVVWGICLYWIIEKPIQNRRDQIIFWIKNRWKVIVMS